MRLFICTDPADDIPLEALTDVLAGYRMTIDIERMHGGKDHRPALQSYIQDCDAFVYALTPNSLDSKRCQWEYNQALNNERPVVIAVLAQVEPFPRAFHKHYVADLRTDEGRDDLLAMLDAVGVPPPGVLAQLFRNRLLLSIVVLGGLALALALAGPFSPYRANVIQTMRDIVAVADRTDGLPEAPTEAAASIENPVAEATRTAEARAIYRGGLELMRAGETSAAIDAYTRALTLTPGEAAFHIARGDAHAANGSIDTAWGDYTAAINLAPERAEPLLSRAAFYLDIGQPDGALADADAALGLAPDNANALTIRGAALLQRGDDPGALAALNRAIELDPANARAYTQRGLVYRFTGQNKLARADFDAAIERNPTLAVAYIERGALLRSQGENAAALDDFSRALELSPQEPVARYERALIYAQMGDYPLAVQDFSRAIANQPGDVNLYLRRASAHRCNTEPTLAVADLTRAAELELDAAVSYLRTPNAYTCAGALPIQPNSERIGETDPNLNGAYLFIAEALANRADDRAAAGDLAAAEADYARAISMNPFFTEVAALYHRRGQMFEQNGQLARAIADYEAAIDIVPEEGAFYIDYGRVLGAAGEVEEAFRQFDRALALNPVSIPAYLAQGDLYLAQGDPDAALDAYTYATLIQRGNVPARAKRARLLADMGDCGAAREDVATLQDRAPDDPLTAETAGAVGAVCE